MKIVIVAPSWIGDAIMAQPLLSFLTRRYRPAVIDVVANAATTPVFRRMPEVRNVIEGPLKHGTLNWSGIKETAKQLATEAYDEAFILPNSFKSALVTWKAAIPIRRGFLGEWRFILLNAIIFQDPKRSIRLVDRYLMLGDKSSLPHAANDEFRLPHLTSDIVCQKQVLAKFQFPEDKPLIALCPGAEYGPSKRWPPEYFAELARLLAQQNCFVYLLGGPKDEIIGQEIIERSGLTVHECRNLCGQTTLEEAIDLLAATQIAITNDSGLMHVAASVKCVLLAIYGSTDPGYTPPLSETAKILRDRQPCSPCFERTCRFGHYRCLRLITPDVVFRETMQVLNGSLIFFS